MSSIEPNPALEPAEAQAVAPVAPLIERGMPLWRMVLFLALPVWTQQFLHLVVTISDSLLAGRILEMPGNSTVFGQSAQTTASYLFWFIGNFSVLVSAGSTALVARFFGARAFAAANRVTNQSIVLGVLLGSLGSAASLIWLDQLVAALQLTGEPAVMAADYLRPVILALPLQLVEAVGIACLIGAGDTITGMWVMSGVAVINLPLAWGFAKGFGPLPALGFVGISTGTAISQALGCLAILTILAYGRAGLQLSLREMRPDWSMMRRILRISIPAGIDSLSVVAGQLWFLAIINSLGPVASAAHGIALRWEALGYMSGGAFNVAAAALVGQNLGAGRFRDAARSGWTAFALGCLVMCVMGAVFFLLAEPMFAVFCPRPEQQPIVEAGVPVLRLIAWAMPALASCIIFTGALRGAGDTRVPVLFTWLGFLGIRIPAAYLLTRYLDWGLFGAWLAMAADLVVRGIAFLLRFASGRWQRIKV